MNAWDLAVIALYFLVVVGMGFWYRRRASENLEAYFDARAAIGATPADWRKRSMKHM